MQIRFTNGGRGFLSSIPPVTRNIIIINFIVWIVTEIFPDFMFDCFSLYYPGSAKFHWWQFVTYMFMHGGFWHIFFNMFTLYMFGTALERVWGPKKFLFFYFFTGLGAAALNAGVQWIQVEHFQRIVEAGEPAAVLGAKYSIQRILYTPTVGASGSIYGLLLGYAMLFPDSRMTLLFPPITMKAKWFVIIFAAIELVTGITGTVSDVAHFAHLGGMLFGLVLILYWKKEHKMYDYYDN